MRTAKTLIRLGWCPGWSESLLGTHSFCWFCGCGSNKYFQQCYRYFILAKSKKLCSEEFLLKTSLHSTLIVLVQVMMKTDEIKFYEIMKARVCKYQKHTDAMQLYAFHWFLQKRLPALKLGRKVLFSTSFLSFIFSFWNYFIFIDRLTGSQNINVSLRHE